MTAQEQTLATLAALLDDTKTPYMIIGGIANLVWGEPRATLDIDVTVWIEDADLAEFVQQVSARFTLLTKDPLGFIAQTRVLPASSREGVRVDVIFGALPFEREAIARAMLVDLAGVAVRVCTPEDLILMKIASDRDRDRGDVQALVRKRLPTLDHAYLEPRIEELASLLERPDIRDRWRAWKRQSE